MELAGGGRGLVGGALNIFPKGKAYFIKDFKNGLSI